MQESTNTEKPVVPVATENGTPNPVPSQESPVKVELERVKKSERTRLDKLQYTKKRVERELDEERKKLGLEGEPLEEELEDDKPVTIGMLKKREQEVAQKTALQLASDIADEHERELVTYHLQNTIKSSGNPTDNYRNAVALVNSVKNQQISQELARKTAPKAFSSAPSAPAKTEEVFEPTAEEAIYMQPPFSLSKEKIIAARKAQG